MNLDQRIREAEARLFKRSGLQPEESFVDLGSAQVRLRVLSVGAGPSHEVAAGQGPAGAGRGALAADVSRG